MGTVTDLVFLGNISESNGRRHTVSTRTKHATIQEETLNTESVLLQSLYFSDNLCKTENFQVINEITSLLRRPAERHLGSIVSLLLA